MARTFISQPNQIFSSERYNDALTVGSTLQSSSTTLETDLNAIRTQIRQLLWAGVSGSWYDAITSPSGSNSARGLNTINNDLTDLEQKRFLFRRQNANLVNIATGSNFVFLSTSLGTAPLNYAVVSHPLLVATNATGTLCAALSGSEGSYGSHSMALTSGSSLLTPKNLVIVRDAWTGLHLTASAGRDVYGLLQVESGTLTGEAFNDSTKRSQISFVYETVTNGTSSLAAVPALYVGGRTIEYSYVRRTALDDMPEDAYLSNTLFLDLAEISSGAAGGGSVVAGDITLNTAIDNQAGTVTQDQNIAIRIAAGFSWTFLSGTKELWKLVSDDGGDSLIASVDTLLFSSSSPATFTDGIKVASTLSQINLGVTSGTINTLTGTNLIIKGGTRLGFSDDYGVTSTYLGGIIPFATSTLEWNSFVTDFGNATSILGALHVLSSSASSSLHRTRFNAGVTTDISADTNVTFPTNLDSQLGSYVGRDFRRDVQVYLNGILLLPGSSIETNDVYPGTSASTGDLKFPYTLRSGSQIAMVRY
jgi:hypothetical protein